MNKQLMIVGFHRSGTSMLAQELSNAGLFIGDKLMSPHISNADGHYEDIDFFTFHEKILALHHTNWQYTSDKSLNIPKEYKKEMDKIITIRNEEHKEWGFKDPRSVLFLNQWCEQLDNPYTIVIYRHYEECVNSLMQREAGEITYNKSYDTSFWDDPTLTYRMWLSYNKKIIEHIKKNPKTSIVVSHDAVVSGFDILKEIKNKFGFSLDINKKSAVKKELLSQKISKEFNINIELKNELEEIWSELEKYSIKPYTSVLNTSLPSQINSDKRLEETLKLLNIIHNKDNDIISIILQKLSNKDISLEDKVKLIKENKLLFKQFKKSNLLIDSLKLLINNHINSSELYILLFEIYMDKKNYNDAESTILKIFTFTKKIPPFYYNLLATIQIKKMNLKIAQYHIDKAIKLNPENPHFYMTASKIAYKNLDYESSLNFIDKALGKKINNANAIVSFNFKKIDLLNELRKTDDIKQISHLLLKHYPSNNQILKKSNAIEAQKSLNKLDKKIYYKNVLSIIKEYPYFYTRIIYLSKNLNTQWAKDDFIARVTEHLITLKKYEV